MNDSPDKAQSKSPYAVTEGINGYWNYHISIRGRETFALCGERTMRTSVPFSQWGVGRAAPKGAPITGRWCKACESAKG